MGYEAEETMNLPGKESVTALILAAGSGERLGRTSKAFLEYRGITLMQHVAALASRFCETVLLGVAAADKARAEEMLTEALTETLNGQGITIIEGGATRQETVGILLNHANTEIVVVHEVARPFASAALFADVINGIGNDDAIAPMLQAQNQNLKVRDVPANEHNGFLAEAGNAVTLQTPQAYRRDVLIGAYQKANEYGWNERSTATLVHRAGYKVKLIDGEAANIKLTYPEDLDLLKR